MYPSDTKHDEYEEKLVRNVREIKLFAREAAR